METTIIDKGNINLFKNLLVPEDADYLVEGKPIFALGLVDGGVACGALAGGPYENNFRISSLFIAPDYRKKGGATKLLDTLKEIMLGIKDLYVIQMDFTIFSDEHKLLEHFLSHMGFTFENRGDSIYSVALESLASNPFYTEKASNNKVLKFSALPDISIRELDRSMRASDGAPLSVPLEKAELDGDLSVAVLDGSRIDGFMLFDHSLGGMLTLAYADSGSKTDSSVFSSMLRTAYLNALKKYPADTKIVIQAVNSLSEALVEKLADGRELLSRSAYLRIKER